MLVTDIIMLCSSLFVTILLINSLRAYRQYNIYECSNINLAHSKCESGIIVFRLMMQGVQFSFYNICVVEEAHQFSISHHPTVSFQAGCVQTVVIYYISGKYNVQIDCWSLVNILYQCYRLMTVYIFIYKKRQFSQLQRQKMNISTNYMHESNSIAAM